MTAPLVKFRGIAKSFGETRALDGVDLAIRPGTIHALIGENGAGKTTLMKLLFGMVAADHGHLLLDGGDVVFRSPKEAIAAGIFMVSQHFELVRPMTVADNLAIGMKASRRRATETVQQVLRDLDARYGMALDPEARVQDLPIGLQQRVEIAKALVKRARLLILDEPTALLGPHEVASLFAMLRQFREDGRTIVFISHKLNEVAAIADHVSVMRQGRVVLDLPAAEASPESLAIAMIGRAPVAEPRIAAQAPGAVVMTARGLGWGMLGPLDLTLHAGETVGIAGVAGNGQSELMAALAGLVPASGTLAWDGRIVPLAGRARRLREAGLAHLPEDRLRYGLLPEFPCWRNLLLGRERRSARRGWLARGRLRRHAQALMRDWDVRPADPDLPAGLLSGGNQQKLVAAREFTGAPKVALIGHATRGVDIGTASFIHRRIAALGQAGTAILLVSFDLDELRSLADRIVVLVAGKIAGELNRSDATSEALGRLMGGLAG